MQFSCSASNYSRGTNFFDWKCYHLAPLSTVSNFALFTITIVKQKRSFHSSLLVNRPEKGSTNPSGGLAKKVYCEYRVFHIKMYTILMSIPTYLCRKFWVSHDEFVFFFRCLFHLIICVKIVKQHFYWTTLYFLDIKSRNKQQKFWPWSISVLLLLLPFPD